jgi:hypothetical protein
MTSYCGISAGSKNCESSEGSLYWGTAIQTPVARLWLRKRHVNVATEAHKTIEE